MTTLSRWLERPDYKDSFLPRHIGPNADERGSMLRVLGVSSLDELSAQAVPKKIRAKKELDLPPAASEAELLAELKRIASENQLYRSYIGMGYSDCITPPVIQRNILENPGWYTQYTPYQAEISQGRLEALLNYQTMVIDLTGLEVANASLLDEGTAAAEAMNLCFSIKGRDSARAFLVSESCHPQTIEVVRTRAEALGIQVVVGNHETFDLSKPICGVLVQYPDTHGSIQDYRSLAEKTHAADALLVVAADLLALAVLTPPGEFGADIAVGSTQRFGVPMGYGGPHAAYFSTRDAYKRLMPGRIIGVSKDVDGKLATRLALQTREQHIRRDKATSNICTAQVLLAVIAGMYATYHGPEGLKRIAGRVHLLAVAFNEALRKLGYRTPPKPFFDTVRIFADAGERAAIVSEAEARRINLRTTEKDSVSVAFDETVTLKDLQDLVAIFAKAKGKQLDIANVEGLVSEAALAFGEPFTRKSDYLSHRVFNSYGSETEMLRYIRRLESRDLSLTSSMIPLGSCTMKLNATAEMFPITWPEFAKLHPFVPEAQAKGYQTLFRQLEGMLAEITGFHGVSLQPNAGSQGEYAGLLVVRKYHESRGEGHRDICLIPRSAHGTNPASAALAGMNVIVVECDSNGNIDVNDLRAKASEHAKNLSVLMVTYPSTHGVFEEAITEICEIVHQNGGQVYMDGANMNAQVGLCRPGDFGPDVCHLNLHKTFCIPHGGGGPGVGPIAVKAHLTPFLPAHPLKRAENAKAVGPVSAAAWGSASILPISWMYIRLMGPQGLTTATQTAILNANYLVQKLESHYPVLYKGLNGRVAHECIFDVRQLKDRTGIEVEDIAKRLMDYGFHAPTISFPVPGTLMVEPTESESLRELDRFCEAMISIREEIAEVETGKADRQNNLLKNAPHTADQAMRAEWNRPYSRERALFPAQSTREFKFWPAVGRINNVLGDRNLICACPSIDEYS
ncbi:MAG: aminomethyl-transferring glycine dehydrogenase [Oligoflexia bacterium]|nr:aminomethyl-transferring glycine dehydrogenase [Oligoflexia bacterium]